MSDNRIFLYLSYAKGRECVRIVFMSDSHGKIAPVRRIVEKNTGADMFIHLGDGENEFIAIKESRPDLDMRFVAGNCDFMSKSPAFHIIEAEGIKALCVHGHRHSVKYGLDRLRETAALNGCSIAAFGHTHSRCEEYENGIWLFNPGSCSYPRDSKGASYGYIDITKAGIVTNTVTLNGGRL